MLFDFNVCLFICNIIQYYFWQYYSLYISRRHTGNKKQIYLPEHRKALWWSFPVLTKGGHPLLSVCRLLNRWRWDDVELSELAALISAVLLKWCQWYSISCKMNSCPALRLSQQVIFVCQGGLQVNLLLADSFKWSAKLFFLGQTLYGLRFKVTYNQI